MSSDRKRAREEDHNTTEAKVLLQDNSMASDAVSKHMLIGTHNGTFHCDEALACYMLKLLPRYNQARIVRTRDPQQLKQCDVVVDVGGEYNPSNDRYDHHQRSFSHTMSSLTNGKKKWTTKLSSAGLVYLHFGKEVIATITGDMDPTDEEELFDMVYSNFVEEVDAVDNGINDRPGLPSYKVTSTISSRVGRLNPPWNGPTQETDPLFHEAMQLVGREFKECVLHTKSVSLPARAIVAASLQERYETDKSGEVILLNRFCPWKSYLQELEINQSISPSIKFVLYPEADSTKWRVQAVPVHPASFENRVSLLEPWRGLRGEELNKITGIEGCVFVHANGFIGGNETKAGALRMALVTLAARNTSDS